MRERRTAGRILVAAAVLALLPLAGPAAPVAAQVGGNRSTTTTATRPPRSAGSTTSPTLVADTPTAPKGRVALVDTGLPGVGGVAWLAVPTEDVDRLRIAVRNPVLLGDASFSLAVFLGVPGGRRREVTITMQERRPVARAVLIDGATVTDLPDPLASSPTVGLLEIGIPSATSTGSDEVVWAETRVLRNAVLQVAATPAFPVDQLRGGSNGVFLAAPWAQRVGNPASDLQRVGPSPVLRVTDEVVELTTTVRPVATVGDRRVASMTDVIVIRPGGALDTRPPVELHVGGSPRAVTLHVAGSDVPRAVPFTASDGAAGPGSRVAVERSALDTALGSPLTAVSTLSFTRMVGLGDDVRYDAAGVTAPIVAARVARTPAGTTASRPDVASTPTRSTGMDATTVLAVAVGGTLLVLGMFGAWLRKTAWWRHATHSLRHRGRPDGGVRRPPPGVRRRSD